MTDGWSRLYRAFPLVPWTLLRLLPTWCGALWAAVKLFCWRVWGMSCLEVAAIRWRLR